MTAYDCHYLDRNGNKRIFCTYAEHPLQAKHTLEELVGPDLARVVQILQVADFDW